jgi:hypothetical protein
MVLPDKTSVLIEIFPFILDHPEQINQTVKILSLFQENMIQKQETEEVFWELQGILSLS